MKSKLEGLPPAVQVEKFALVRPRPSYELETRPPIRCQL
jgi:hypothetical protein